MNLDRLNKPQQGDNSCISELEQGHSYRSPRILLVEDNDLVRVAAKRRLTKLGYSAVGVPDADHALTVLMADDGFDYLLADIMLTGLVTGTMLACQVRVRWPSVKVVLMTGYQEFAVPGNARAGDFPLLLKPFATEDLIRTFGCAEGFAGIEPFFT